MSIGIWKVYLYGTLYKGTIYFITCINPFLFTTENDFWSNIMKFTTDEWVFCLLPFTLLMLLENSRIKVLYFDSWMLAPVVFLYLRCIALNCYVKNWLYLEHIWIGASLPPASQVLFSFRTGFSAVSSWTYSGCTSSRWPRIWVVLPDVFFFIAKFKIVLLSLSILFK